MVHLTSLSFRKHAEQGLNEGRQRRVAPVDEGINDIGEEPEHAAGAGRGPVVVVAAADENVLEESVVEYGWRTGVLSGGEQRRNALVHSLALLEGDLQVPVMSDEDVAGDIYILDAR